MTQQPEMTIDAVLTVAMAERDGYIGYCARLIYLRTGSVLTVVGGTRGNNKLLVFEIACGRLFEEITKPLVIAYWGSLPLDVAKYATEPMQHTIVAIVRSDFETGDQVYAEHSLDRALEAGDWYSTMKERM